MPSATTPLPARIPGPGHAAAHPAAGPGPKTQPARNRAAPTGQALDRATRTGRATGDTTPTRRVLDHAGRGRRVLGRAGRGRRLLDRAGRGRRALDRVGPTRQVLVRAAWPWLRMAGGAGILALLLWRVGSAAFLDGLRVIDRWALLSAFGIGVLTTVCAAWRWRLVARGLGMPLPLPAAVAGYFRAVFLNAALPGGVLGDVHRAVRHGRHAGDVGMGVRAVVLERAAGQVVLVVVAAVVLVAFPSPVAPAGLFGLLPAGLVTGALVLLAVGLAAVLGLAGGRAGSRCRRVVRTAVRDLRDGLLSRGAGPGVAVTSAAALAGHVATFLLAARVAGVAAPLPVLLPLAVLALLAMALPLNVGGWGPREGVCAWAFGAAGLGTAQGLTTAVVYGVFAFAASLPGLAVLAHQWVVRRAAAPGRPSSPGRA